MITLHLVVLACSVFVKPHSVIWSTISAGMKVTSVYYRCTLILAVHIQGEMGLSTLRHVI